MARPKTVAPLLPTSGDGHGWWRAMALDLNPSSICLNLGRSGTSRVGARYIGGIDSGCGEEGRGECVV
jgi:hypothetical protein